MLPVSSIAVDPSSGKVPSRPESRREDAADDGADTLALGHSGARRMARTLRAHTRGAVERTNCQIVLLADEGRHAPEIAWLVRRECIRCARCRIGFKPKAWPGPAPRAWTALLITPLGCRSLRPA